MRIQQLLGWVAEEMRGSRGDWSRKMKIYPSDLGSEACPLAYWRQLRDYPSKESTAGELLMFKQGDNLENEVAQLVGAALIKHETDWEIVDTQTSVEFAGLTGRIDLLLRNTKTGELAIIEVKSKRGNAFRYLEEPKPNNVLQCQCYMAGVDAGRGLLVYVDREGQNFLKIFPVKRDDDAVLAEKDRLVALRDSAFPPDGMRLNYKRNKNKGDDSLELSVPWQMTWCRDKECPCAERIGNVPKGVIAKVDSSGQVYAKDPKHAKWVPVLQDLIDRG